MVRFLGVSLSLLVAVIALGLGTATVSFAAPEATPEAAPTKKTTPLPKSGSLSVSGSSGYGNTVGVDLPWGGGAAPVSGSVSKLSQREWVVKVFNNSKDSYSVDVEVVSYGDGGKKLTSKFDSFNLKPKGKGERKVNVHPSTVSCALNLRNWKNLSESKKEASEETEAETKAKTKKAS